MRVWEYIWCGDLCAWISCHGWSALHSITWWLLFQMFFLKNLLLLLGGWNSGELVVHCLTIGTVLVASMQYTYSFPFCYIVSRFVKSEMTSFQEAIVFIILRTNYWDYLLNFFSKVLLLVPQVFGVGHPCPPPGPKFSRSCPPPRTEIEKLPPIVAMFLIQMLPCFLVRF